MPAYATGWPAFLEAGAVAVSIAVLTILAAFAGAAFFAGLATFLASAMDVLVEFDLACP